MEKIEVKEINETFNEEILDIIRRSPISTNDFTLHFDRAPKFFSLSKAGFEYSRYAGLFINGILKGFVGTSYYDGMVNGKKESIIYYTNLYVLPEARKRGFFFSSSEVLMKNKYKNARLGLTVVMKGNANANKLIGRRAEEYPLSFYSRICGDLTVHNILISLRKRKSKAHIVRKATLADTQTIVALLQKNLEGRSFAPIIDKDSFLNNIDRRPNFSIENYYVAEKEGKIVGVCGAMDLNPLKRTRVIVYKGKLRLIRFIYMLLRPILGMPPLPKKGESFKDVTLIDYACENNDPSIMESLIRAIYLEYRKLNFNSIIFGSYSDDPLLDAVRKFHSTKVESNILLGCESEELLSSVTVEKPYVNVAFL